METAPVVKSRLILNLVLLLALIGIGLFVYFRPAEQKQTGIAITQLTREDVERARLQRANGLDVQMEKRHGTWYMLKPISARIDPLQMDRVLDLVTATASDSFAAENLSRYGLDPPMARVSLNEQSFAFGSINEVTNEQYLGSGASVYMVRTFFGYSLPVDVSKLISHRVLAENEKPVAFDFGQWQAVRSDKGAWSLQGSLPSNADLAPSPDELNVWVAEWTLASALSAEPSEAKPEGERFRVEFSNGERAEFVVVSREAEVQLVRTGEKVLYRFGADAGARLLDPYRVAAN